MIYAAAEGRVSDWSRASYFYLLQKKDRDGTEINLKRTNFEIRLVEW